MVRGLGFPLDFGLGFGLEFHLGFGTGLVSALFNLRISLLRLP